MAESIGLLNQHTHLSCIMGSNPISSEVVNKGGIVQLVERMLCTHEVIGSNPIVSIGCVACLCSSGVERFLGKEEASGSSPDIGFFV